MKVLIVDSSIQIVERLKEMVSEAERLVAIHKAVSYKEATDVFLETKPDVVVLDLGLPANRSFDLIWEMKNASPAATIIILSIHTDIPTQEQCHSLGADFFFDKYNDFEKITGLINTIATNKKE